MPPSPLDPDELQRAVDQANDQLRAIARDDLQERRHNAAQWRARYVAALAHYNAAVAARDAAAREPDEEPALAAA